MSDSCTQSCTSCEEQCTDRVEEKANSFESPNKLSRIKKVIAVVSGKGGVGKSMITSLLAVTMNRKGYHTAILDADITGPSIPKAFGIRANGELTGNASGSYPAKSENGIDIMSVNLLLKNETDPVVWRGPIISNTVKQFWQDIIWEDVDYMFLDMPPGTGDVPLTVFQSIPVDGIVIVTSPQELVSMIVGKAVKMANLMKVPILGIVENMAYFECPDCKKKHNIFGDSHLEEIAQEYNLKILGRLPMDPALAAACDAGEIESFSGNYLDQIEQIFAKEGEKKMKIAVASETDIVTGHFGHCTNFNIFDTEGSKIIQRTSVDNPGHKPGFLPKFLHEMGVSVIISGGMGQGAVDIFVEKGIVVITGAEGRAEDAVNRYLQGNLVSNDVVCQEHQHQDSCGSH